MMKAGGQDFSDLLVADAQEYESQFDIATEAEERGGELGIDLEAAWGVLAARSPVQEGDPRTLLNLPNYRPYGFDRKTWSVLNFRGCARAMRDNQLFSSKIFDEYDAFKAIGPSIINKVGEEHRKLRAVAQPFFLQQVARTWWQEKWIGGIADALLTRLEQFERADLNLELCGRMPIHTIIRGIGIAPEDALTFRNHLMMATGMRKGTMEDIVAAGGAVRAMLRSAIAERRVNPRDDLISRLIEASYASPEGERLLSEDEVLSYCQLLILAGGTTTWRQLGIILHALMTHYDFWEACRDDRSLIPQTIEEGVRWLGTQQALPRLVTSDTELEGTFIPAGSQLIVCVGAANRDPERWERPGEFDIFRPQKPHLSFGGGPHICIGMHVAKQEIISALNGLMDRFPNMRPDAGRPPAKVMGTVEARGMSHVGVILR